VPDSVREYLRALALVLAILVEVLADFASPIVGLLAPAQWLGGGLAAALTFLLGYLVGRRHGRRRPGAPEATQAPAASPGGRPSAARESAGTGHGPRDIGLFRDRGRKAGRRRR
jgi:hypothetical protein